MSDRLQQWHEAIAAAEMNLEGFRWNDDISWGAPTWIAWRQRGVRAEARLSIGYREVLMVTTPMDDINIKVKLRLWDGAHRAAIEVVQDLICVVNEKVPTVIPFLPGIRP